MQANVVFLPRSGLAKFGPLPADALPAWSLPLFVSGIVGAGIAAAILNAFIPEDVMS